MFYLKAPEDGGRTLRSAYLQTLRKFFHVGLERRGGAMVEVLPPADQLPTFDQFLYWARKGQDIEADLLRRTGERKFKLTMRPVLGDSTLMAYGPGSLIQIDATPTGFWAVSSMDRTRRIAKLIDFGVKIFLLAQVRAITTGSEKITPSILESVAKDSLRSAQPALNAIRTGDMRAVATMTDLHPIDFQSAVQRMRKASLLQTLSRGSQIVSDINTAAVAPPVTEPSVPTAAPGNSAPAPAPQATRPIAKRRRAIQPAISSKCLLVQTANAGLAKSVSAHDALAEAGLIKPLFKIQNSAA